MLKVTLMIHLMCMSVYILCIDKLLEEFERICKEFQRMKFIVSFANNPFQGKNISGKAELISSVLKEHMSELELRIINFQNCY
jgi:hypothetical protein